MPKITRRKFLIGCSTAIASMAGAKIGFAAFENQEDSVNDHTMVVVFLRGGLDMLSTVVPLGPDDRQHYESKRPRLKIPESNLLQIPGTEFGFHPSMAPLLDIYNDGYLGIIQGVGLNVDTRSHFDAMAYMEQGTNAIQTGTSGWITRFLESGPNLNSPPFEALSTNAIKPSLFANYDDAVTLRHIDRFNIKIGPWGYHDTNLTTLDELYARSTTPLHLAGRQTIEAINYIAEQFPDENFEYFPANGATYPDNEFGDQLKQIAQMIKLQIGLKVATVDLGGWDTHEDQAYNSDSTQGYLSDLLDTFSRGLAAFFTDINSGGVDNPADKISLVVMSEFGRRLRENENRGTDHGHGGGMFMLGGAIQGGMYGDWPGLHPDQLYDNADLAVTTDYRHVLSEIMVGHMGNPNLIDIFPGYTSYEPLQFLRNDLSIDPIVDVDLESSENIYLPMFNRSTE